MIYHDLFKQFLIKGLLGCSESLFYTVYRTEPKVLNILGKCFTSEQTLRPYLESFDIAIW